MNIGLEITHWTKGEPLPPLNTPCPRCGAETLRHYIDYKQRQYKITCLNKLGELKWKSCPYFNIKPIEIRSKAKRKGSEDQPKKTIKAVRPTAPRKKSIFK